MFRTPLFITLYTLVVIIVSSLMTTAYFHYFVLNTNDEQQSLVAFDNIDANNSPIKEDNTIIELFSYGCHYCALNEENLDKLEARMPAGSKLIRLHINNEQMKGLASFSSLFATLTVMGIEPQHRQSAYDAIIRDKIDLSNPKNRDGWLREQGIEPAEYVRISQTQQVKTLLSYMTEVSRYYNIDATPSFIVNRKWLALQEREFPEFADHLLSLLQHDQPLEP